MTTRRTRRHLPRADGSTRGNDPVAVKKTAHRSVEGRRARGEQPRAQTPPSGQAGWGSRSLEVRWIRRGPLPPVLIERFGPFRDPIEQRADRYLVDRWTPELGVKIRDAVQLDLKAYRGSAGYLRVPGGCGPLEVWEKWTFPLGEMSPEKETESWLALDKRRRKRAFELTAQGLVERSVREEGGPRCMFELTEVVGGGDLWWTLGFEASGAAERSSRACEPASACSSSAHCPMASSSRRRPRCPTRAGSVNANPGHRAQLRLLVLLRRRERPPGVARSWRIDARTRAARADIIPRTRGWGTTA